MYLRKLEIHGFKSFAKKTVLEFEPGITSIVGPNGSGKSNLADALRWVFGEQSLKLLRGKKSEDVIFAGSQEKARLGVAEVAVHFDNADRVMPLDYAEVVIARRLFRDGNSEYLLNNNQVRLLDIVELLSKSGFGNTSYHVIGQGMIDQLILGGPAAIKELVEEASGVKPYYVKRERTLRRLEHTEVNLQQVQALLEEIAPRLRSLRRQTKKLERREEIEKELREAQLAYYGQQLSGLKIQTEAVNAKISVFDKQIAGLNAEIKTLAADIEQEEQAGEATGETQKLRGELAELHKLKTSLLEKQAMLRGKLKAMELRPATAAKVNWDELKAKLRALLGRFRALFSNFQASEAKKIENEFSALLSEIENDKSQEEKEAMGKDKNRLAELTGKIEELTKKITTLDKSLTDAASASDERKRALFVKERLLRNKQDTLLKTRDQKNQLAIEQARLQTRREAVEAETRQNLGPDFAAEVAGQSGPVPLGLTDKIASLKKQLEMIGGVDDLTIQEHKETEERYQYLSTQSEDLKKAVEDLRTVIAELDEVIKKDFNEAFASISEKFAEYFRVLFGGGRATMILIREKPTPLLTSPTGGEEKEEDEFPPLEGEGKGGVKSEITGIEIRATPPGKKLSLVSSLSGGEKALVSIALLSAILATYPSPFVVLDEVDAALDEANSIRFGKILGTLAHRTQFITITHNRETMRQSHTLYGVTMGDDGVSRVLSLKLEQAAAYSSKN